MQKSFKAVIYRIYMPTDMSPNKPIDLLAKEFNVEHFEKADEMILHVDYKEQKEKAPRTGRYIAAKSKKETVGVGA